MLEIPKCYSNRKEEAQECWVFWSELRTKIPWGGWDGQHHTEEWGKDRGSHSGGKWNQNGNRAADCKLDSIMIIRNIREIGQGKVAYGLKYCGCRPLLVASWWSRKGLWWGSQSLWSIQGRVRFQKVRASCRLAFFSSLRLEMGGHWASWLPERAIHHHRTKDDSRWACRSQLALPER